MGWSGGTEIFDTVADECCEVMDEELNPIIDNLCISILSKLVEVLEDKDWDNACESDYWTHPIIGEILGNRLEDENE